MPTEPDIQPLDRDETVALMEPMVMGEGSPHRTGLKDLALELAGKPARFRRIHADCLAGVGQSRIS